MRKIRLKSVTFDVDFRKSELTNYREYSERTGITLRRKDEALLFVSSRQDQLCFILGCKNIESAHGERTLLDSRKWRISGGCWNPLMLQNYAESVGLHIIGLKRFEDVIAERRESKRGR